MDKQCRTHIFKMLQKDIKGYILIFAFFIAGMLLSSALNISTGSKEEIKIYISDFLSNVKNYSIDSQKTFRLSMSANVNNIITIMLLSTSFIGNVGILAHTFLKGFSYGAVLGTLFNVFGTKTAIFIVFAILPHLLVVFPCYAAFSLFCFKKSNAIKLTTQNAVLNLLHTLFFAVVLILILCLASFVQAYIEPVILRMITI